MRTYGAKTWDDAKAGRAREREVAAREIAPCLQGHLRVRLTLGPRIEQQGHEVMPDEPEPESLPPGEYVIE